MRGKEREKTRVFDDNKLKVMEEFKNYNFSGDQKSMPNNHSNYMSLNINNNNSNFMVNSNG